MCDMGKAWATTALHCSTPRPRSLLAAVAARSLSVGVAVVAAVDVVAVDFAAVD